jgi:hypothetical protein
MATISENLQIIKDSTDAIKQAIIDKGGTIEGDITTWANAISGISGGGSSSEEEITFVGRIDKEPGGLYITGSLSTTFSTYKRIWAFTYGEHAIFSNTVIADGDADVSLGLTAGPFDLDPSLVTLFLTDADGANAKLLKIILLN